MEDGQGGYLPVVGGYSYLDKLARRGRRLIGGEADQWPDKAVDSSQEGLEAANNEGGCTIAA
jgi:hypothetical protein